MKYLVWWKRFIVEYDIWKREEDLENTKEAVADFEEKISIEVRQQEKLERIEEKNFRREELLGKYMAKMLYDIRYSSYLVIWDSIRHIRSLNKLLVCYPRTQKIELKQYLAFAYVLCLYQLY